MLIWRMSELRCTGQLRVILIILFFSPTQQSEISTCSIHSYSLYINSKFYEVFLGPYKKTYLFSDIMYVIQKYRV